MARQAAPAAPKAVSKGKDKKLRRKAEAEKLKQKEELVQAANQVVDLLAPFAAFQAFKRNGVEAMITCSTAAALSAATAEWAFRLCKTNMQTFYENARDMGWSDTKKRAQLMAEEARLLVVTGKVDGGGERQLAYSHFRFEMEGECPVLYCWELQVEEVARRRGLGRFLMRLLELLACRAGMEWVMLTVMTANADAFALYSSLGYTLDETSPSACDALDDAGYEILSKKLPARRSPAAAANAEGRSSAAARTLGGELQAPMAALAVS